MEEKIYRYEHGRLILSYGGAGVCFQDERPSPTTQEEYIERSKEHQQLLEKAQQGLLEEITSSLSLSTDTQGEN